MKSTSITLGAMVDLALGTPEIGSVNFNMLHSLLHEILNKLNLSDTKTDVDEDEKDFLFKRSLRIKNTDRILETDEESVADSGVGSVSVVGSVDKIDSGNEQKRISRSAPTPYHALKQKVNDMEDKLIQLTNLPSNSNLFEKVKDSSNTPIGDMWGLIQVQKKAEANEQGLSKLTSLIEDLILQNDKLRESLKEITDKIGNFDENLKNLEKKFNEIPPPPPPPPPVQNTIEKYDDTKLTNTLDDLKRKMDELEKSLDKFELKGAVKEAPQPNIDYNLFVKWSALEDLLNGIRKEIDDLNNKNPNVLIEAESQTDKSRPSSGPSNQLKEMLERIGKLADRHDQLQNLVDDLMNQLLNKADKSALDELLKLADKGIDTSALLEIRKELDNLKATRNRDADQLRKLQALLTTIQSELERMQHRLRDLSDEGNERQKHIDALYSIAGKLDENKVDKEDMKNELSKKADKKLLGNKVDRTLFDTTCDDLSKMISEILERLATHDDEWKKAIAKLTAELDGKFDRLEFGPIRADLERQLRNLQNQLKNLRCHPDDMGGTEDNAAALRRQLLQKYNCLSCDKPLEISIDHQPLNNNLTNFNSFPGNKSQRPYTTFELDEIRQLSRKNTDIFDLYSTNRQCGGQHTVTFPHRRVNKVATFSSLDTEKDELINIEGADGRIYKGGDVKLPSIRRKTGGVGGGGNENSSERKTTSDNKSAFRPQSAAGNFGKESNRIGTVTPQPPPPSEPGDKVA